MQPLNKQHGKFEVKDNKPVTASPEELRVKQGLKELDRQILGESDARFSIIATDYNAVLDGRITEKCGNAFYVKRL